jgi:hypothetical protein
MPRMLGGTASRTYMLDAGLTFQYDQDESLEVPAGTRIVALPNAAKASNAVSALDMSCTQNTPTTLGCHRSFALKSRFIAPEAYVQLKSVLSTLGRVARQPVILAGTGGKS